MAASAAVLADAQHASQPFAADAAAALAARPVAEPVFVFFAAPVEPAVAQLAVEHRYADYDVYEESGSQARVRKILIR
jgi:hypothetical protein